MPATKAMLQQNAALALHCIQTADLAQSRLQYAVQSNHLLTDLLLANPADAWTCCTCSAILLPIVITVYVTYSFLQFFDGIFSVGNAVCWESTVSAQSLHAGIC